MMRPSTFFFLTRRGVRNLGKHWAMTIACIASLSVCMTLNIFASLAEVNVGSMVSYLGSQNETVVYLDPECDDATAAQVGETLSAMPGVSGVQYVSWQPDWARSSVRASGLPSVKNASTSLLTPRSTTNGFTLTQNGQPQRAPTRVR